MILFPGLLGSKAVLLLIFGGNPTLLPTVAAPIYNPTNSAQGFFYLHILANTLFLVFSVNSHSNRREVTSHCGFDLHFLNN